MGGETALLPAGLADVLPPAADEEAAAVERSIASFRAAGYRRVKPPLLEFEEALLSGTGAALTRDTFRLMDPVSQRMLGLRADMTPQVARIAAHRLGGEPRPLRLCYAGQVLRVRGTLLRPERQFGQVGAELIGSAAWTADLEVCLLASETLHDLGLRGLTLDLSTPTLVTLLAAKLGLVGATLAQLRTALDGKDAAAVRQAAGADAPVFLRLLQAVGPLQSGLRALAALDLPSQAREEVERLKLTAAALATAAPWLDLTIDPVESRGYEYQTGLSFTIFAREAKTELGRGGRYRAERGDGDTEPATGFSLFMDSVLRALPPPAPPRRLYLAVGAAHAEARRLRQQGWTVLRGLEATTNAAAEARRLGCTHWWNDGAAQALHEGGEG